MWMRVTDGGLAALLYGPCSVSTTVSGVRVQIEEKTSYPFKNEIEITVQAERKIEFPLLLRDPGWSHGTAVTCEGAAIRREGGYWIVTRKWKASAIVTLEFRPTVREVAATNGEVALQYGALLFVQRIEERKTVTKTYPVKGFEDTTYLPIPGKYEAFVLPASARFKARCRASQTAQKLRSRWCPSAMPQSCAAQRFRLRPSVNCSSIVESSCDQQVGGRTTVYVPLR
jgi:DUF1680 family protein